MAAVSDFDARLRRLEEATHRLAGLLEALCDVLGSHPALQDARARLRVFVRQMERERKTDA